MSVDYQFNETHLIGQIKNEHLAIYPSL